MKIFNIDLDNTLIFSDKHTIGSKKQCVEIYKGREASFITEYTDYLLKQVRKKLFVVPTTTRSVEQYNRIDLGFLPEYALICNGGVLLKNGQEEKLWYKESVKLIANCKKQLSMAEEILKQDSNIIFEIRTIRELFIVTKSKEPLLSVNKLKEQLDNDLVDIFYQVQKVYIIPKKLRKGIAVKRLKEKLCADYIIAAGDSEPDISMFWEADIALAPKKLKAEQLPEHTILINEQRIFSESVLEYVLKFL